ncbi:MAG: hypothetical protein AB7F67_21470 [Rhodospirillaceae bacterium]
MAKLTSDDAFDLSRRYHDLAMAVADHRFDHRKTLKARELKELEDLQWSLMNASSDLATHAVGLVLDETQASLAQLRQATDQARKAIRKLDTAKKVLTIAGATLGLAMAVMSKDIGAVASNAKTVLEAVKGA